MITILYVSVQITRQVTSLNEIAIEHAFELD